MGLSLREIFTFRNIATFLLVLFCIRYIPLETRAGASIIKLGAAILCAAGFVIKPPPITRALIWGGIYYAVVILCTIQHSSFRWSTMLYLLSFLIVFIYFYNCLYVYSAFSLDYFIRLVKWLILAYFVVLVLQQFTLLLGIHYFPLINLQFINRGIGANSLSGEPSSEARILAIAFFSLIRAYEIEYSRKISLAELYKEAKWPCIGFFWSMCTMGSGTAFVALPIVLLYFVRKKYLFVLVPLMFILPAIVSFIEFKPLQRAFNAAEVTLTLDKNKVMEDDGSAARGIMPMLNTVTTLDLFSSETWFGNGIDAIMSRGGYMARMKESKILVIDEYGLICFIIMQIFIYSCVIKSFFSLESLIWILIFSMSFSNVAYVWGVMILFASVRYFQSKHDVT